MRKTILTAVGAIVTLTAIIAISVVLFPHLGGTPSSESLSLRTVYTVATP